AVQHDQRLGTTEDRARAAQTNAHTAARLTIVLRDHRTRNLALECTIDRRRGWRVVDLIAAYGRNRVAESTTLRYHPGTGDDNLIQLHGAFPQLDVRHLRERVARGKHDLARSVAPPDEYDSQRVRARSYGGA